MKKETSILLGVVLGIIAVMIVIVVVAKPGAGTSNPTSDQRDVALVIGEQHQAVKEGTFPVTIVEFGDYECPACGYYAPLAAALVAHYRDNPSVNFVFRHFHLPMHNRALIAAEVAEAAGAQGKYWEMHELLYDNQDTWSTVKDPMVEFEKYANKLKLNVTVFKQAVESNAAHAKILAEVRGGQDVGVNSTPTFFINGAKLKSVPDLNRFIELVDGEVAKLASQSIQ